jgi:3-oxoacyl-[acyl-carrier-protein] synthase-3
MLLDQESVRRVALVNADVLSRKVSRKDRNSYPLVGDAAVITLLERQHSFGPIYANMKVDGTRSDVLIIPAGGFRMPSTAETAKMEDAGDNNFRAKDHLCMDGSGVFNFVQVEVPPMIEQLFSYAGVKDDDVDWYIFHQPNRFMLHKLADKMKIPYKKMPSNVVEHYGNSSGTTIPVAMVHNLSKKLVSETMHFCIAGFGVGLSWASMYLKIGNLRFCEMMEYP